MYSIFGQINLLICMTMICISSYQHFLSEVFPSSYSLLLKHVFYYFELLKLCTAALHHLQYLDHQHEAHDLLPVGKKN